MLYEAFCVRQAQKYSKPELKYIMYTLRRLSAVTQVFFIKLVENRFEEAAVTTSVFHLLYFRQVNETKTF